METDDAGAQLSQLVLVLLKNVELTVLYNKKAKYIVKCLFSWCCKSIINSIQAFEKLKILSSECVIHEIFKVKFRSFPSHNRKHFEYLPLFSYWLNHTKVFVYLYLHLPVALHELSLSLSGTHNNTAIFYAATNNSIALATL